MYSIKLIVTLFFISENFEFAGNQFARISKNKVLANISGSTVCYYSSITSTQNLYLGAKIRKIGLPQQTPFSI